VIIERLDLIAFGHLTDVSFDLSAGPHRFHVVYGPNESGKSTSLRAIHHLLFGFPHKTDDDFQHAPGNLRVGGKLRGPDGTVMDCVRRKGRKGTLRDSADNEPVDHSRLTNWLGGLDAETFSTQFGLSHEELLRGGEQILRGEGELGELLFAAGAGISRLREVQTRLTQDVDQLYRPRAKSVINEALGKDQQDRQALKQLQVPAAEYVRLQRQITDSQLRVAELRKKADEASRRRDALQAQIHALPLLDQWQTGIARLNELSGVPRLPEEFSKRRIDLQQQLTIKQQRGQQLTLQLEKLSLAIQQLGDPDPVWDQADPIDSLHRELPIRETEAGQREQLQSEVNRLENNIRSRLKEVAFDHADTTSHPTDPLGHQVEQLRFNETDRRRIQRLATAYDKHLQQKQNDADRLEQLQAQLQRVRSQLTQHPPGVDPAFLTRTLEAVGSPEQLIAERDRLASQRKHQRQTAESLHKKLAVRGDLRTADELVLPDVGRRQQWAKKLEELQTQLHQQRQIAETYHAELEQAEQSVQQLEAEQMLPTRDDLDQTRRHRDELLESVRVGDAESVESLRVAIAKADDMIDQMFAHHEAIHQRQAARKRVEESRRKFERQSEAVGQLETDHASVQQQWDDAWRKIGVTPQSPPAMKQWEESWQAFRAAMQQSKDLDREFEEVQAKMRRVSERLEEACRHACEREAVADPQPGEAIESDPARLEAEPTSETPLFETPSSPDETNAETVDVPATSRLYQAVHRLKELRDLQVRHHTRRDKWVAEEESLLSQMADAEVKVQASTTALEKWQDEWNKATATLPSAADAVPHDVLPMLEAVRELTEMKRQRDEAMEQQASITQQNLAFCQRVFHLAKRITPEASSHNAELQSESEEAVGDLTAAATVIDNLYARLQAERIARPDRDQKRRELQESKQNAEENGRQLELLQVQLQQLLTQARCDDVEQLETIEHQSKLRETTEQRVEELTEQLVGLDPSKDSRTKKGSLREQVEAFAETMTDANKSQLEQQLAETETLRNELVEQIDQQQQSLGVANNEFAKIDGSAKAAELSQQMQLSRGTLQRHVDQYVRLKLAASILQRAMDRYRHENQAPVLAVAEGYFRTLTCGEYAELKVDLNQKGTPILYGVKDKVSVPAPQLSSGTADSLYLALRLASLQHQWQGRDPVPLILDDCLMQLDDSRAAAAMKVLSQFSTTTQVILFTHHRHLLDLADQYLEEDEVHVHRLGRSARGATDSQKSEGSGDQTAAEPDFAARS